MMKQDMEETDIKAVQDKSNPSVSNVYRMKARENQLNI